MSYYYAFYTLSEIYFVGQQHYKKKGVLLGWHRYMNNVCAKNYAYDQKIKRW